MTWPDEQEEYVHIISMLWVRKHCFLRQNNRIKKKKKKKIVDYQPKILYKFLFTMKTNLLKLTSFNFGLFVFKAL